MKRFRCNPARVDRDSTQQAGGPAPPLVVELLEVARCVHALPITAVAISHELPFTGDGGERLMLENASVVIRQVVEDGAVEYEETAADQRFFQLRFLAEGQHAISLGQRR